MSATEIACSWTIACPANPIFLDKEGFRNNPEWEETLKEGDYGFKSRRGDLKNLEVLVLEVNPSQNHLNDDEIIMKFWAQWFEEMGVKKYKICTSDLPGNTKELIAAFMKPCNE